jgi:hypothetical protein
MRWAVTWVGLAACSFSPGSGQRSGDGGTKLDAAPSTDGVMATTDATTGGACGWTFAHTNFDACALAASPAPLDITATTMLDPSVAAPSRTTVTQSDGTMLVIYHLSELSVASASTLDLLDAPGVAGLIFAVEGNVTLGGRIITATGANDPTHCATSKGEDGVMSTLNSAGAGGGGGGGAAAAGGDGTDGAASGFGVHGARGALVASAASLAPLRGGCAGGRGAKIFNGQGTGTVGGRGGGAIQIAARGTITITGEIDAAGRGGGTSSHAGEGGGGGGAGGGVLLEAPGVTISGRVCADGGSGAQGGGAGVAGVAGTTSPCIVTAGAVTSNNGSSAGGNGGVGGYAGAPGGGVAGAATTGGQNAGGGGGGGGGAVGWIRIHAMTPVLNGQLSPVPLVN